MLPASASAALAAGPRIPRVIALVTALWGAALAGAGCQDPCVTLAERICNCEPTPQDRRNCRSERITSRQSQVEIEESDRLFCEQKLDTCSCAALDENKLELCGFVAESE